MELANIYREAGPVSGYWVPTQADQERLEADFAEFYQGQLLRRDPLFRQKLKAGLILDGRDHRFLGGTAPAYSQIVAYYRQYVGCFQNGHRVIFVNALEPEYVAALDTQDRTKGLWHRRLLGNGLSGPNAYHVLYDLAIHQFRYFSFSGDY